MMESTSDRGGDDALARLPRSWIDVFANCGTIMGRVLSFLDEIDVLQLEGSNERMTVEVTGFQWAYLDKLDRSRNANKRWRQPPPDDGDDGDNHLSRLRGIDFANNFLYAQKRSLEAYTYFEFDRDDASPEDIPVRHNGMCLEVTQEGKLTKQPQHQKQSMPPCWQQWVDFDDLTPEGNQVLILDVFLDISFHRDNPCELLSWRGFRKARYQRYQGISVKLDLESLAKDIGWTELLDFRNHSKDYAFTHFEVEKSQKQMKFLMQKIQITLHFAGSYLHAPLDEDPLMIISTGGYAFPAWARRGAHMVFARNANICRFHCRNGREPLAEILEDASRSAFLRIPTASSSDQTLGIMLKIYN